MTINSSTKIEAIIKANKAGIEVIASLAKPLEKLRNPVLRSLMAGRVTIAEAAKMGGCSVEDFKHALEPLGFSWVTSEEDGINEKTFKTLPFIVWNNKFRLLNGKVKVPMPKHLYKEQLVQYQFWCFVIALVLLMVGISLACIILIRIAMMAWILTAFLYVYNVGVILFYKIDTNGK